MGMMARSSLVDGTTRPRLPYGSEDNSTKASPRQEHDRKEER